jgi:hypothetical protein
LALAAELCALNANFFGFDHRISALVFLARTLWLRGFSDQALRIVQKPINEAASRDHPFRSAFRWFMRRRCYCGPVIWQEPVTSSSS